jgi:hypothetical protein
MLGELTTYDTSTLPPDLSRIYSSASIVWGMRYMARV